MKKKESVQKNEQPKVSKSVEDVNAKKSETVKTLSDEWTSPGGRKWKNRREQTRHYILGYI